jgi:hypothetical protein
MTMNYIEAPNEWDGQGPSVFLAGGITGCPDWQATARDLFHRLAPGIVVVNPRRANFQVGDPTAGMQIAWEHENLHRVTATLFWFPVCDPVVTVQPIALFELGAALDNLSRRVAVGADPDYPRQVDVVTQAELARPGMQVNTTLARTVWTAIEAVRAAG